VHGRLVDYGGYELFAMTPLKANTGWIRREIFKKREQPGHHGHSRVDSRQPER
jgi:hypothetical protein